MYVMILMIFLFTFRSLNIYKFKVRFKINGDLSETGIRWLNEDNKSVLKRSSVDSFIMAAKM